MVFIFTCEHATQIWHSGSPEMRSFPLVGAYVSVPGVEAKFRHLAAWKLQSGI